MLACNVNALMAATATRELGNKMIRLLVMSTPSLAVTTNREQEESKNIRSPAMSTPLWL